jgi:hypothetical protein
LVLIQLLYCTDRSARRRENFKSLCETTAADECENLNRSSKTPTVINISCEVHLLGKRLVENQVALGMLKD